MNSRKFSETMDLFPESLMKLPTVTSLHLVSQGKQSGSSKNIERVVF